MTVAIDPSFDPAPSLARTPKIQVVTAAPSESAHPSARATFVSADGEINGPVSREALAAAGFTGSAGQSYVVAGEQLVVLVGIGDGVSTVAQLRDAVATFTRAAREAAHLEIDTRGFEIDAALVGQAAVEGALLARYRYDALKREPKTVALESLTLIADDAERTAVEAGADRGKILARSANLARDLANSPPRHLTAVKLAEVAAHLGPQYGLDVTVHDHDQITELGLGGLLGVNAGSTEEPRMISITYRPEGAQSHLAFVGKGIMFDSGGISLKPANAMHAAMKLDMTGAAAVFAAMTALRDLGVTTAVSGWMMCTDNMPSGSATKLGDVLTIRGGTTVEIKNTDAEGRLVLADGLVLATEQQPDAIVDIATLTGAALAALGDRTAAMLANHDGVAEQLLAASDATDETIWRLPLDHRYRPQLNSEIADLQNIGGQYGGMITAALFLNEFVGDIPWGHLDIAGTMMTEKDDLWRSAGSTGFGARLLVELAAGFTAPRPATAGAEADEQEQA